MKNNGCYQQCSNCNLVANCCTNFDKINAPVLNPTEIENLKNETNQDFFNKVDNDIYTLKTNNNKCIFFINHKCTIYDKRPIDCKLYPFDIINLDEKYYLILYNLPCINIELFKKYSTSIDSLINDVKPWIKSFTDKRNFDKMQNFKYTIIKEISIK